MGPSNSFLLGGGVCNSFTVTLVPSSSFCMSYLALSLGGALYSELLICLKGGKEVALGRK